jgi:hypothetical protein
VPCGIIERNLDRDHDSACDLCEIGNAMDRPYAGVLNSKEEVSWIVLCSVRYRGQRMA